jgi:hypothetical protein
MARRAAKGTGRRDSRRREGGTLPRAHAHVHDTPACMARSVYAWHAHAPTAPCARVAHEHDGGGGGVAVAAAPALAQVGAARLLAHGRQLELAQLGLDLYKWDEKCGVFRMNKA